MNNLIDEDDVKRIRGDAYIAIDALEAIAEAGALSTKYLSEKLEMIKSCISFFESFTEDCE